MSKSEPWKTVNFNILGWRGHIDRVKLKPRNLLKKVVTEKAQYMYLLIYLLIFFLKLKIAFSGLFSITAQFGCLVS